MFSDTRESDYLYLNIYINISPSEAKKAEFAANT